MKTFLLIILVLNSTYNFANQSEWKQIGEQDQITIFSKEPKNGVLPFKAIGMVDAGLSEVLEILKGHQNKHLWAPKLEKVTLHKEIQKDQKFLFSEYYKTPWPASDREFLLLGEIVKGEDSSVILKAHSVDQSPEYAHLKSSGHVQADVKYINLKLTSVNPLKTKVQFEFHGDMKGWMPLWLMNLIQKKWPLRFIQGLRKYQQDNKKLIGQKSR